MKPDWKDAPEWAQWMAMDCNGDWYFYEEKPYIKAGQKIFSRKNGSRTEKAYLYFNKWRGTIEKRPTTNS